MKPQKSTETDLPRPPGVGPDEPARALGPAALRGQTVVVDGVVSTLARITAEQVPGIHRVGGTGLRGAIGRLGHAPVSAEVGTKEAAVTIDVVIQYGYPIRDVAAELRTRVLEAVEMMASRKIVAVDVNVIAVHVERPEPRPLHELS